MESIEVKAKVNGMEKGQVTTFEYEGNFYDIRVVKQVQLKQKPMDGSGVLIPEKPSIEPTKEKKAVPDRGKCIGILSNNYLYQNIYKEINEARDRKATHEELLGIIAKYHPLASEDSLGSYLSIYNRYRRDDNDIKKPEPVVEKKPVKTKIPRKYTKSQPSKAIGYCKTYGVYIYPDDYEKVINAVNKYGGIATTDTIAKETGIYKFKVSSIIRYMKDNNIVSTVHKLGQIYYIPVKATSSKPENTFLKYFRK